MSNFKLTCKEVRIEPTNICNAHCVMCPRDSMTRKQGIMSIGLYRSIVDQCADAGAESVSIENFGEPFCDQGIFQKAEYSKSKGLRNLTITNASLLTDWKISEALELFDVIRVSKYGMTKESYEAIHRGLSYDDVESNIERLFKLNDSLCNPCEIQVYFLMMDENRNEVESFIQAYGYRAKISVWNPHNWTSWARYRYAEGERVSCGRPQSGPLQVLWDGTVVPCCFDYNGAMVLGDFKTQTLEEIMRGEAYNDIRQAHISWQFNRYPTCAGCDQLCQVKDSLIYTNIDGAMVGATNTEYFSLGDK